MKRPRRRLVAVVGTTATGKTALGLEISERFSGEVIGADSRQVYRCMDVGTAKPTPQEQAAVRHHVIDVVDPDGDFSLAVWLELAQAGLEDIWGRGKLPVLVGGTGQYVSALLEGWSVPKVPAQPEVRRRLARWSTEELLAELRRVDPGAEQFIDPRNVRRVVRALEVQAATGSPFSEWRRRRPPSFEALTIGIYLPRKELYTRIDGRVDEMFRRGFVDEVRGLRERGYGRNLPSMSGIGYRQVCELLDGEISFDNAIQATKTATHRLARHQGSWFKRTDERIFWVVGTPDGFEVAVDRVRRFIDVEAEPGDRAPREAAGRSDPRCV